MVKSIFSRCIWTNDSYCFFKNLKFEIKNERKFSLIAKRCTREKVWIIIHHSKTEKVSKIVSKTQKKIATWH